ncbi:AAA family ATPase [Helicobacter sp. MIT 21-1697]|uniref:AAA family ATPase n=1 Tax=Helicobacter sp. MIT 21-1697 TaxID=2993733 RepID=UPI00224B5F90|nr:AAA family ATPase [Helicobacter sp. MIT 21-1697]MCX2716208.1 AAA family ATPase [Helicobacter sp. MIT 21-1697]
MIKKIHKINFKSFNNYMANIEFKEINLIYGLNGKGKSSFAQFLQNFTSDKNIFECSQKNYKIFNYDELYKRNTLYINDDNNQNAFSSFYAGDDIVKTIKKRDEILEKIDKANSIKQNKENEKRTNEYEKDKLKENIARDTREILNKINSSKYKTPQSYTKAHIKDDDFYNANTLNNDEFKNCEKYSIDNIPSEIDAFVFDRLQQLPNGIAAFQEMLKESPENQAIERFKQDSELESFAKAAINLRKKYPQDYNEKCPLCEQNILQTKLWEKLEKHFNQEYQKFIERLNKAKKFFEDIRKEINEFENWLNKNLVATKIMLEKKINIDNLRQDYLEFIKAVNNDLKELLQKLQQKLNAPNSKDIEFIEKIDFSKNLERILSDELKNIINSHNKQLADYQKIIDENIAKIKRHFIAKEKYKFLDIQKKITTNGRHIKRIENCIKYYNEKLGEINEKLKEIDKSFEQLNNDLREWFFEDIRFEKITDSHYKIQRQNFNEEWFDCKSGLSEGEKTIISVIYFINSYLANLNNLQEYPLLIIDDPITSLDSQNKDKIVNYIVQKVQSNQMGQLFILSHDKTTLINFNKKLKVQKGQKQILEISKRKLSSEFKVLEKIKLENDLREIYNKLNSYINDENAGTAQNIKELPRQLLEGLFAIVFEDNSNFTECYGKILTKMEMEMQYNADDIQKLNHNKNMEEKDDEVLNKCKFIVKIFEKFIHANQA